MYYLDLTSFAVGLVTGIAGCAIFVGFAALLVTNASKDLDKRGLSARHSDRELRGSELSVLPSSALPVLDPLTTPVEQLLAQADLLAPAYGPGSPTAAGMVTPSKPPRLKRQFPRT